MRLTRPDFFNAYGNGFGVVPRRSWDHHSAQFLSDIGRVGVSGGCNSGHLRWWAAMSPLVVLSALIDVHPMAQLALNNDLAAAFKPDTTRIIAVSPSDPKQEADPDATALLDTLWNTLPADHGGLSGIQWTMGEQVCKTGMYGIEAVLSDNPAQGVVDVADFSPLSIRFRDTDEGRILEQRQNGIVGSWVALDRDTCFAHAWRGSTDQPYGMARYGAFLSEGLADVTRQSNLADVLYAVAWPHLAAEFPWAEMIQFAIDHADTVLVGKGIDPETGMPRDLTAMEWATNLYGAFRDKVEGLKADDIFVLPSGAKVSVTNAANLSGLSDVLTMARLRVVQSLDHLPALMGITDGGTQAYATEQSRIYYNKLEAFQSFVNKGIVAIANLHLRRLGLPFVARVETEPLMQRDRGADAQAEQAEIGNTLTLLDRGFISPETAGSRHGTGDLHDVSRVYASQPKQDPQTDPAAPKPTKEPQEDNK